LNEGRAEQKKESVVRAWELNLRIAAMANAPAELRERAWQRCAEMIPFLPQPARRSGSKETFIQDASRGLAMLSAVGAQVGKARTSRDIAQRKKNLELQRQVVDALLPGGQRAEWRPALHLFALNWMEEVDYSKRLQVPPRNPRSVDYDPYGNPIYYSSYGSPVQMQQANPNQLPRCRSPSYYSSRRRKPG
jgi:hypothetical protein